MGEALRERIRQDHFASPAVEAILNLIVATDFVRQQSAKTISKYGLTSAQYKVLRILRGGCPSGYPRCEIISRMLERAPDVTRLVDRLEKAGLVARDPDRDLAMDRRWSITRITEKGLKLLEEMGPAVENLDRFVSQRLTDAESLMLSALCEKLYGDQDIAPTAHSEKPALHDKDNR